ncbi:MAG: hypothetical protein WEB88_14740 [Gemmatimonadota bacterium]|jgi:hypothetical protein
MAKVKIFKKDGTPTPFYWLNQDSVDRKRAEVFKRTSEGIKRLKGVRFNTVSNRMRRI